MTTDAVLTQTYADLILPHLEMAKRAYGSRATASPQHDASREYTRLLVEYYEAGGSLLAIAEVLGVTYAGLRRRVMTAELEPSSKRPRKHFSQETYDAALTDIMAAKQSGVLKYHCALFEHYEAGISLTKIAKMMGLSSANPLYYGVTSIRNLRKAEQISVAASALDAHEA